MARILFCTDSYPPQINGVSVVTADMAVGLQQRGWSCAVLSPAYPVTMRRVLWPPDEIRRFEIASTALPHYPEVRLAWPTQRVVRRIFDAFRPDLVHCATELAIGRAGMNEATARGIPVCTTLHTDFGRYCRAYRVPFLRPLVLAWMRRFHGAAHRTLVPSRVAQRDRSALGHARTTVWHGGVDAEQFHPRHHAPPVRLRHGVGRAFTFLHVGRLAPEKNVSLVLRAFERLRASLPEKAVRLLVVGSGPSEAALRRQAGAGVTFLSVMDRTCELPALYASVDGFVSASATETLGLVLLEAMASGLPVVACQAGGVADYLEHAHNGLAFEPEDEAGCAAAMRRLAMDASLHERLRAGARHTAERWSSARELDRLDELYRGVLTSTRRAVPRAPSLSILPAR